MLHSHFKYCRTVPVDPNETYGTSLQATYDNLYYHDGTYPMIPLNWPPINPHFPLHSGQPGLPVVYWTASNASYVKMNSAAVKYNKFDEKEGSKEEPVYERVWLS